jgi:hypothetical protein
MATIGHRFEEATELRCSRCGHLHIVPASEIVRPCTVCMHIEFDEAQDVPEEDNEAPVEIGLRREEIEANVRAVLKARGGFAAAQIDTLSEAISRSLLANNRRLQEDIEAAFRSLEQ